jgi:hypothetical protein
MSMWIGSDYYVTRLDDLEIAFRNPLPQAALAKNRLGSDARLSRDECLERQGTLLIAR